MFKRALFTVIFCAPLIRADFSYEQSSKVTGGVMAGAMKVAGFFSKAAREPMRSTVMVKGNRLATVSGDSIMVIDLDKEAMTSIDLKEKRYSTITFAEMTQAMARMAEKASQQKTDPNAEVDFKVDVKSTGQTRVIQGFNTKQAILTIEMQGKDKESGQTGAMGMTTEMWLTPKIAGYDEVQEFYKRMSQKLAWSHGGSALGGMAAAQPGMQKAMARMAAESAKLDGVPVFQVMKMGGRADGAPVAANTPPPQQQPAAQQEPQQQENPAKALGRLGGRLGGFGGFGKKKTEEPAQQEQAQNRQQGQPADTSGALLIMETETTGFSSAPVDASRFDVPAGFKQVEHEMKKAMR